MGATQPDPGRFVLADPQNFSRMRGDHALKLRRMLIRRKRADIIRSPVPGRANEDDQSRRRTERGEWRNAIFRRGPDQRQSRQRRARQHARRQRVEKVEGALRRRAPGADDFVYMDRAFAHGRQRRHRPASIGQPLGVLGRDNATEAIIAERGETYCRALDRIRGQPSDREQCQRDAAPHSVRPKAQGAKNHCDHAEQRQQPNRAPQLRLHDQHHRVKIAKNDGNKQAA